MENILFRCIGKRCIHMIESGDRQTTISIVLDEFCRSGTHGTGNSLGDTKLLEWLSTTLLQKK